MFKEEAAKEVKQAMENILRILAALTLKKTAMVSEATNNFQDSTIRENKRVLQGMSKIQKISCDAKAEMSKYAETVQKHFTEDTFSFAESTAVMENCLNEWHSFQLSDPHRGLSAQGNSGKMPSQALVICTREVFLQSILLEKISRGTAVHEEYLSVSATMDTNFDARTDDMMASVNDSLMQDHENKREIGSMTALCLDQLKSIQENHGQSISNIRNHAENCLTRDYFVDQNTASTPKKRAISIPSSESIEEMRTSMYGEIKENLENKSKWSHTDCKIPQQLASQNRAPFCDVN